jgi:hypothetical protein
MGVDTRFAITALFVAVVFGQPPAEENLDRVFHITHTEAGQSPGEIATVIRVMTEIRQVASDGEKNTLAVRGTPGQVALAEWLVDALDKPDQNRVTRAYRLPESEPARPASLPGGRDDVVRVFYPTHAGTPRELQELAVALRSIYGVFRLFTYSVTGAIALRGTADQIAVAEWLFNDLDKRSQIPGMHELRLPGGGDDLVRVFYLANSGAGRDVEGVATAVRSKSGIRGLLAYTGTRAVVVRGTAGQIALAGRLINELDQPADRALGEIDAMVAAEFARRPVGSVTIGVVSGKQLIWSKSYGFADMEERTPASKDTVYRIGSVTKMFTALMLAQLADDGKVRLSDPVEKYFPEVKTVQSRFPDAAPITLVQLSNHTTGLSR